MQLRHLFIDSGLALTGLIALIYGLVQCKKGEMRGLGRGFYDQFIKARAKGKASIFYGIFFIAIGIALLILDFKECG